MTSKAERSCSRSREDPGGDQSLVVSTADQVHGRRINPDSPEAILFPVTQPRRPHRAVGFHARRHGLPARRSNHSVASSSRPDFGPWKNRRPSARGREGAGRLPGPGDEPTEGREGRAQARPPGSRRPPPRRARPARPEGGGSTFVHVPCTHASKPAGGGTTAADVHGSRVAPPWPWRSPRPGHGTRPGGAPSHPWPVRDGRARAVHGPAPARGTAGSGDGLSRTRRAEAGTRSCS